MGKRVRKTERKRDREGDEEIDIKAIAVIVIV